MTNRVTTRLADGTYGLFISKPGIDVLTADPWDMVFDSRIPHNASIYAQGTATRGQTVTFPALPYIPMVLIFGVDGGDGLPFNYYQSDPELAEDENGNTVFYNFVTESNQTFPYVRHRLMEPVYRVTASSLEFVDDYTVHFDPSGGYTARYAVLRAPGG
jgi:hypothetical protein